MRRPAFFVLLVATMICGNLLTPPPAGAQQSVDAADVSAAATGIAHRAEQLKPILEEVHPAEWVAKGAPDAYVSQWSSLVRQNEAIANDMAGVAQRADADAQRLTPLASVEDTLRALFRLHRFDGDLSSMLGALRRYQEPEVADRIEAISARDVSGIEKLQQYALDLTNAREQQIAVMDKEAQRCRSTLAIQPVNRPAPPPKKASGTSGSGK